MNGTSPTEDFSTAPNALALAKFIAPSQQRTDVLIYCTSCVSGDARRNLSHYTVKACRRSSPEGAPPCPACGDPPAPAAAGSPGACAPPSPGAPPTPPRPGALPLAAGAAPLALLEPRLHSASGIRAPAPP